MTYNIIRAADDGARVITDAAIEQTREMLARDGWALLRGGVKPT